MDERFIMHQMKAMKISTRIGAVLFGVLLLQRYFLEGIFDWQLFTVLVIMAAVKLTALVYLQRKS
jgi:hypothetical protein